MRILQARILEWVAMPASRGSSQSKDQTQVYHIAGGFFTVSATREAQEYWSGYPIPSPGDLPNPGIEPALQVDFLPAELPGKPGLSIALKQLGFCGGSDGKEFACSAGDPGSVLRMGRSRGEGNGNPLQYSWPGNSVDRGAW